MRIERLVIQAFGRLQDIDLMLKPGFQMIYGANEQGKSTMMAFIRAMFYGFAGGGRKLETNERRLYTPWNGQRMGGAVIFEYRGTRYRLERQFGKTRAQDITILMHDTTGKTIEIGSQNEPGQFLFDLSENEFNNTVFVRQLGSQLGPSDDLLARLSNLAGSGDASVSHAQIDQRIRQAQTDLIAARGRGGRINDLADRLEQLHLRREKAVEAASQQMQRIQTLQLDQKSLEQLALQEAQLQERASWQEKLIQTAQWQRIQDRRRQLDLTRMEQTVKDQALQYGPHTVTAAWLNEIRGLEQSWQEKTRQLKDKQQALDKVQDQSNHLEQEGERFNIVASLNRTQANTLRSRLADQKNEASALRSQVRDQETSITELQKQQEQLDQLLRSKEDDQNAFSRASEKAGQELAAAEKNARTSKADIEQADQEFVQKETELQQHRQNAALQNQDIQSGLKCSKRCRYIFAAGLMLSLISGLSAVLLSQVLILFVVVPCLLIPLFFWLAERSHQAAGNSESIKQSWQHQLYLLESDLRLAGSRQESAGRIFQLSQRAVDEARQRWQQVQGQALANAEKYAASEKALRLAINRCRDSLQAADIDTMKQDLDRLDRSIAADNSAVSEILRRCDCADWNAFDRLLQEYDQYKGAAKAIQQARELAAAQLERAADDTGNAAALLAEALSIIKPNAKPDDAAGLIDQLQEALRQADQARGEALQEAIRFQDILGDRTYADWEIVISRIHVDLAQMQDQPSLLNEEQMHLLRSEIREMQSRQIALREKIAALESVIRLSARHQEPVSALDEKITAADKHLASMQQYHQRLSKAREALDQAASELQNSFGPQLNQKAGKVLAELTAGKYNELKVDRSFMVRLSDPDDRNFHEWQYLSGGTIDQVYLALRLAISDLICEQQELLPLLFDDILIQYDDIRTAASLNYFAKKCRQSEQQILFFSCQKRFSSAVESAGWPVIELA